MRAAWMHAKGARTRELRGDRRVKTFDSRGLHPYSVEWGRILALEALLPDLEQRRATGDVLFDPVSMRHHAEREAEQEFYAAIREGKSEYDV